MTAHTYQRLDTTSAPSANDTHTGAGSIAAVMISKGVLVSKFTPQGTIRPFGQDTGTADDSTVLAHYFGGTSPL